MSRRESNLNNAPTKPVVRSMETIVLHSCAKEWQLLFLHSSDLPLSHYQTFQRRVALFSARKAGIQGIPECIDSGNVGIQEKAP